MWNGKKKAVTFSYDDGVVQDIRFVELLNKYELKCTFNLNSGIMNKSGEFEIKGQKIRRMKSDGMNKLYKGHEIAVHTAHHVDLTGLSDEEVIREIADDKLRLEEIFGCEVVGMAYPYGAYDNRIMKIAASCGIRYARTTMDAYGFNMPENFMCLRASCRHRFMNIIGLIDEFLAYKGNESKILNIWGHSYEFDVDGSWQAMEKICSLLSHNDDIFYGTNREVYLPEI